MRRVRYLLWLLPVLVLAAAAGGWYYLNGLYTGQRCDQQAETASAEPPAVEVSPQ